MIVNVVQPETLDDEARKIKILVTGGGGAGNEAIYRLLCDKYELHFADADVRRISPVIPNDRCHCIPMAVDDEFRPALIELCNGLAIDVVMPTVDEELLQIHELGRSLGSTKFFIPTRGFTQLMLDKLESMSALRRIGVDAPLTVVDPQDLEFPMVVKPRRGRGSRGVRIVHNERELQAHLALHLKKGSELIAQERIVGQEYTVMVSADAEGEIRAIVPVRVLEKQGVTLRGHTERHDAISELCFKIHKTFKTQATYNVQLIATSDGRLAPFEVNPRASTTLCLAVAARVDPYKIFLSTTAREGLQPFVENLHLQRSWYNNFHQNLPT